LYLKKDKKMENLLEKLYTQIQTELEFCDSSVTPVVCYNYSNVELRNDLLQTIAETILSRKINISEAIVEVERLYSVNNID
jgi:hypothetical protein